MSDKDFRKIPEGGRFLLMLSAEQKTVRYCNFKTVQYRPLLLSIKREQFRQRSTNFREAKARSSFSPSSSVKSTVFRSYRHIQEARWTVCEWPNFHEIVVESISVNCIMRWSKIGEEYIIKRAACKSPRLKNQPSPFTEQSTHASKSTLRKNAPLSSRYNCGFNRNEPGIWLIFQVFFY